jgi:hypothetical protein
MNGFAFIEYKDPMDARDVVPGKNPPPNCCCRHKESTLANLAASRQLFVRSRLDGIPTRHTSLANLALSQTDPTSWVNV